MKSNRSKNELMTGRRDILTDRLGWVCSASFQIPAGNNTKFDKINEQKIPGSQP